MLTAHSTRPSDQPAPTAPIDAVALDYDGRFLRRKLLRCLSGAEIMVDLPKVTALAHGDLLITDQGDIEVRAAEEDVLIITGDLARLAWHIGNRHTPCQIAPFHLVIRQDHVLAQMLQGLGAKIRPARQAFVPEGGAYGAAQVMGHDHGHSHSHGHSHGHSHAHPHSHSHAHGDDCGCHSHAAPPVQELGYIAFDPEKSFV